MDRSIGRFTERMAVNLATDGYPRIAGRIYGLLLLSSDGLSLDDLTDQLGVSKASASTNARLLEQRGIVERYHQPSDRRDYYRVYLDHFERTMSQRLEKWQRVSEALREARDVAHDPAVLERLELYEARYGELSTAWRGVLSHWATERQRIPAGAGR
ncbi:MAG: MarR family transcriptional regulator [Gemmatimonadales bacterium]